MKAKFRLLVIPLLFLSTLSCAIQVDMGGTATPTPDVAVIVKATTDALTAQAPTVSPGGDTPTSPPPVPSATATSVPVPSDTVGPAPALTGGISGTLSYPAGGPGLPPMVIVAYHVGGGPMDFYHLATSAGSAMGYEIDGLPAGSYHVVAYSLGGGGFPSGLAGGYTPAVPCGLTVSCTDHSLLDVVVAAGAVTPNINPGDWYAPDGTFPPNPVP